MQVCQGVMRLLNPSPRRAISLCSGWCLSIPWKCIQAGNSPAYCEEKLSHLFLLVYINWSLISFLLSVKILSVSGRVSLAC